MACWAVRRLLRAPCPCSTTPHPPPEGSSPDGRCGGARCVSRVCCARQSRCSRCAAAPFASTWLRCSGSARARRSGEFASRPLPPEAALAPQRLHAMLAGSQVQLTDRRGSCAEGFCTDGRPALAAAARFEATVVVVAQVVEAAAREAVMEAGLWSVASQSSRTVGGLIGDGVRVRRPKPMTLAVEGVVEKPTWDEKHGLTQRCSLAPSVQGQAPVRAKGRAGVGGEASQIGRGCGPSACALFVGMSHANPAPPCDIQSPHPLPPSPPPPPPSAPRSDPRPPSEHPQALAPPPPPPSPPQAGCDTPPASPAVENAPPHGRAAGVDAAGPTAMAGARPRK